VFQKAGRALSSEFYWGPGTSSSKNSEERMMMDRQVVRQCDMEVMKMAMLKHEETFRQQVNDRDLQELVLSVILRGEFLISSCNK